MIIVIMLDSCNLFNNFSMLCCFIFLLFCIFLFCERRVEQRWPGKRLVSNDIFILILMVVCPCYFYYYQRVFGDISKSQKIKILHFFLYFFIIHSIWLKSKLYIRNNFTLSFRAYSLNALDVGFLYIPHHHTPTTHHNILSR